MLKNKRKNLHIGLWTTGILVLGIGIFSFWVSYHYKAIIRQQLPSIVAKNSDSLYHISLGDISINVLTRTVTLKNIRITTDTDKVAALKRDNKLPAALLDISVQQIHIAGIQWENLASNSSFDCKYIIVNKPVVIVNGAPKPVDSVVKEVTANKKVIASLSAEKIDIENPNLSYHFINDSTDYTLGVKGGKIVLSDWKYIPGKGMDTSTFLFAHTSTFNFDSFSYSKKGSPYNFGSSGIAFSSGDRNLTLKSVAVKLLGSRSDFYKKVGHQKEIYTMMFPTVKLSGLNWKQLLNNKRLLVDTMEVADPSMDLYFDRTYPASTQSKVGHFPHQLLLALGMKMEIKKVLLTNGHFKYTEMNDKTRKEGIIHFDQMNGTVDNVTNIDSLIAKNDKCIMKIKGKYMNRADVAATFRLILSDSNGTFSVDGNAQNVNAPDVNQPASNLGMIEVSEFHVSKFDFHVEGNEHYAKGGCTMLYDALNISFLKLNEDNNTQKKGLGTASLLANKLALFPANPMPDKEVRHIETYIQRDPRKGFFNLIWKNIFMGANNTVLRSPQLVANVKEQVKGKKEGIFKRIFGKKRK